MLDATSTWYALRFTHLSEGNPALRWAFDHVGLGPALVLRVVIGCGAASRSSPGVSVRGSTFHDRLFNTGCQVLLFGAIAIWGTVAVSNITQILAVNLRLALDYSSLNCSRVPGPRRFAPGERQRRRYPLLAASDE